MSVFPPNNLPDGAKYWARDVEKRIINAETSFQNAEINNVTRDSQVLTTANEALAAAVKAQTVLDGLIGLGQTGSTYSINADNINAGTITGITVQTGSSGTRAVMSGSKLDFYFGSTRVGDVLGDDSWSGNPAMAIRNAAGTRGFYTDATVAAIHSGLGRYFAIGSTSASLVTPGVMVDYNGWAADYVRVTGGISASADIEANGSLRRTALAGGGTTGASINDAGNFQRTTSSARYKTDIRDLEVPYEAVLELQPKVFKRKDEFEAKGDAARDYAGFVAEELAGTDLDVFVAYEQLEDGTKRPDGIYYAELTAALVSALKHQDSVIKNLTERIEALESK